MRKGIGGTVYPRPAKRVEGRNGRTRLAPLRPGEVWTNPRTGKVVRGGKKGSTWTWSFSVGSYEAGDRRTFTKGGHPTKSAAQADLTRKLAAYGQGDERPLQKPVDQPLGAYLDAWLAGRDGLRPSTIHGYQNVIDVWVKPHIGRVPLSRLTADRLVELFDTLRTSGGRQGKPLGSRSVKLTATLLNMALADAVEGGGLPFNPMDRIPRRQRPKHRPQKQADRYWTPEEARRFLAHSADDRLYPLWAVLLDTGMRRGEACALRWDDLDLDAAVVHVRRSRAAVGAKVVEGPTKSAKPRSIPLDARTVNALRAWRTGQARERLAAGGAWSGGTPGESGYVWTDEVGDVLKPSAIYRLWLEAQERSGLPRLVVHGARHTMATALLSARVPVTTVSERLGHSQVSITLDTYGHAIPDDRAAAATVIGDALYGKAAS